MEVGLLSSSKAKRVLGLYGLLHVCNFVLYPCVYSILLLTKKYMLVARGG